MVRFGRFLALILALLLCATACGRMPPPIPESGGSAGAVSAAPAAPAAPVPAGSGDPAPAPTPPEEEQPNAPGGGGPASPAQSSAPEEPSQPEDSSASQPEPSPLPSDPGQPESRQSEPPEEPSKPEQSAPEEPSDTSGEDASQPPPAESLPESQPEEQTEPTDSRWLNITEATILTLINKERVRLGVPPLTMDPDLTAAARVRGLELYRGNYVAHTRPGGASWETVLRQDVPVEFALAAENLAWVNHAVGQDIPPFQWFQMWQQSDSHYAAMVNDHYTHCGVAVLAGSYFDGEEQSYAVALFCSY